jgi:hypothetical protein
VPAQDGARGEQAVLVHCGGQGPDERGEYGTISPGVQSWCGVGSAQEGTFVAQDEQLNKFVGAEDRPSNHSQPSTRTKIR